MRVSWVVSVLGADRAGIVSDLSKAVAEAGGNWEDSRLVQLAGRFAGVVKITCSPDGSDAVLVALAGAASDMQLEVLQGQDHVAEPALPVTLQVTGTDRAGIVRDVAAALGAAGAHVDEFTTDYAEAPMAGGVLFRARVRTSGAPPDALQETLHTVADDLLVDIIEG